MLGGRAVSCSLTALPRHCALEMNTCFFLFECTSPWRKERLRKSLPLDCWYPIGSLKEGSTRANSKMLASPRTHLRLALAHTPLTAGLEPSVNLAGVNAITQPEDPLEGTLGSLVQLTQCTSFVRTWDPGTLGFSQIQSPQCFTQSVLHASWLISLARRSTLTRSTSHPFLSHSYGLGLWTAAL